MSLGRPRDAARYYDSFWSEPIAALHAGRAYQAAGENERARAVYRFFVASWSEPDPELAPLVAEAREALARLEGRGGAAPRAAATCPSCRPVS